MHRLSRKQTFKNDSRASASGTKRTSSFDILGAENGQQETLGISRRVRNTGSLPTYKGLAIWHRPQHLLTAHIPGGAGDGTAGVGPGGAHIHV